MPMGDPSAKPYRWRDTPRSEAGGADRQTAKPGRWRGAWHRASYPGHAAHAHSRHSRLDGAAVARSEAPQEEARSYPSMSLSKAREVFTRDFADMIQKGRSIKIAGDTRPGTVADLFEAYVAHLKASEKSSWKEAEKGLNKIADTLGRNRPARDIEPDDMTRKDVKGVIESLPAIGYKELTKTGAFFVPGFAKFVVIKKPATKARKGINPFTKEPTIFKAKPARKIIRARPVKAAKDAVS